MDPSRKSEIEKMRNVKRRTGKILTKYLGFGRQKLKKELGAVLKKTLEGLEKLHHFLDAVEKLAVTSLFVFTDEIFLPRGVSPATARSVILTARTVCPLLIHFKRDDGAFFLPSLHNVDVLAFQLDKYIRITQQLCESMKNPSLRFSWNMSGSMENMTDHFNQLSKIRMDESFRLTYLFGENTEHFFETYSGCRSSMFQFLSDLEGTAVELDKMKKGSSISTVAGSSVSAVGGVLSIVGLALAPVTAGVSLGLTISGIGLGVTSGANSLVTGFTELGVNSYHRNKANNIFKKMMEDVQKVLDCLENAASSEHPRTHLGLDYINIQLENMKILCRTRSLVEKICNAIDGASAVKTLRSEKVIRRVVGVGLQEASETRSIPSLAADLPDIGQLAKGTPLAMSKAARAGFITLNVFFIGMDIGFIYKESKSLANKETSEDSQFIRTRSALLRSEIEAWDKIYDTLKKGKITFQEKLEILKQPFPIM
ncbi:apolipoprotein L3-like [Colossoma macropomum]|uniref:apolipoprotein L3-like n=1 Tax=Colossoma macropomum TaxID=42526 RepID=UPI0018654C99|nr:apolipoprotein L3-like [Colossoma macropomum]